MDAGYFSLSELEGIYDALRADGAIDRMLNDGAIVLPVECDLSFKPTKLSELRRFHGVRFIPEAPKPYAVIFSGLTRNSNCRPSIFTAFFTKCRFPYPSFTTTGRIHVRLLPKSTVKGVRVSILGVVPIFTPRDEGRGLGVLPQFSLTPSCL
jgi:hypothetical protein